MMPRISPASTARLTFDSAVRPPNFFVSPLISSSIGFSPDRNEATLDKILVDQAADAAGHVKHGEHDHAAENHQPVLIIVAGEIIDEGHQDGADDAAPDIADAAKHHH